MIHTCQVKRFKDIPEIAKKIRLENTFHRELRPVFRQINKDFRVSVAAFGRAPDVSPYKPVFNGLLQKHYSRVQAAFRDDVADQNGGKAVFRILIKQDIDALDALIGIGLLDWRNTNANSMSELITQTNERQMDRAIFDARVAINESDDDLTPNALATLSAVLLARKFAVRSGTISQTETQGAAESTKQIEASAISGKTPFSVDTQVITPVEDRAVVTKTWRDLGDKKVRPSHVAVDGTTVGENEIFTVGGSQLRFPGDNSLGASIGEIINCRCSGEYKVK